MRVWPYRLPFGWIDAHVGERVSHVLQIETDRGELRRVELDADRRVLLAADADEPNAWHLRQLLREDALGVVIHRGDRQDVRGQPEHQDRRVRRIGLVIGRRRRHVLRKLTRRGVDRGLHQLCRGLMSSFSANCSVICV